jgi:ring-1,2-phenylacetyl-CoA epoxidase subunit PaaE
MDFFPLKIKHITPETSDSVTIEFEIPNDLSDTFLFKQGQYVTLKLNLDGQELRRSYSMSSSPFEKQLAVSVKKVSGGKVSTYLHEKIKAGDTIEVAKPEGRFTSKLDPEKRRTYYMFASGSGITPIYSMCKAILEQEPMSTIFLLYGNKTEESIMFKEALDRLSERYHGQMMVEHVLSQAKKETSGGLFGMFKKSSSNWKGKTGRIDARAIGGFIDDNLVQGMEQDAQYFICGPGNMADAVKSALLGRGLESKQIHTEHFVSANHVPGAAGGSASSDGSKKIIVHLKGERIEMKIAAGTTILDTLIKDKYDPPYSCTAGACSTCMAKLINGKVKMDACYALDDSEVKDGYILTCQAHPETDVVELTYDM